MRGLIAIAMLLAFLSSAMAQTVGQAASAPEPQRQFVVFFQDWSADLDDPSRQVLIHLTDLAKAAPAQTIIVTGFADPTGSPRANALISALRAERVSDFLVTLGVPVDKIETHAVGGVDYALSSQESRRVTIAFQAN
jgi:outer membrane protein OmpA-like peptidoglycan-associated protein